MSVPMRKATRTFRPILGVGSCLLPGRPEMVWKAPFPMVGWQNGYCTSLENWRPQGLGGSSPSPSVHKGSPKQINCYPFGPDHIEMPAGSCLPLVRILSPSAALSDPGFHLSERAEKQGGEPVRLPPCFDRFHHRIGSVNVTR